MSVGVCVLRESALLRPLEGGPRARDDLNGFVVVTVRRDTDLQIDWLDDVDAVYTQ